MSAEINRASPEKRERCDDDPVCETVLPECTEVWITRGRYAGLRATLLQFVAHATTHADPFGECTDTGFYLCSVLMRNVKDGRVTDLIPRRYVSLIAPWERS